MYERVHTEKGYYYLIDTAIFEGVEYGLYESESYGDEVPAIVLSYLTLKVVGETFDTLSEFFNTL